MSNGPQEQPDSVDKSLGDQPTGNDASQIDPAKSLGEQSTSGDALSSISDQPSGPDYFADSNLPLIDLARYKTERQLGQGGMGSVVLATDQQLKRQVAIKRIVPRLVRSQIALQRFVAEAQSIAALNHFNIVQVHDFGRDANGPLLVLEYVSGGSLLDKLKHGRLQLTEAVNITCQLCDALSMAHRAAIIHRDIKPANILLTEEGIPKLTDFGLVRQQSTDPGQTSSGTVLGTLDYMSPEQRRNSTAVDARSDLWSLAATLYQMITGNSPKVIRLDQLPASLARVIGKMVEEDRAKRYQSAGEFKSALKKGLAKASGAHAVRTRQRGAAVPPKLTKGPASRPPKMSSEPGLQASQGKQQASPQPPQLKSEDSPEPPELNDPAPEIVVEQETLASARTKRRATSPEPDSATRNSFKSPAKVWIAAVVALVLVVLGFGFLFRGEFGELVGTGEGVGDEETVWHHSGVTPQESKKEEERIAAEEKAAANKAAAEEAVRKEPDSLEELQAALLAAAEEAVREEADSLEELQYDYRLFETLRGHSRAIWNVAFSPNQAVVASSSLDQTIKLWNTATGALIQTLTDHRGPVTGLAFSPDGSLIASGSHDRTVKVWTVGGKVLRTLRGHEGNVASVAFSPDGEWIASGSKDGTIKIWRTSTGELQRTISGHTGASIAFQREGEWLAGSTNGGVTFWDPSTGVVKRRGLQDGTVWALSFSPDGKLIAGGGTRKEIQLRNVKTGTLQRTLKGHEDAIHFLAFNPNGRMIASSSWDHTVKLWDIASGDELKTLSGHEDRVFSVAFSPNGKLIATGSEDDTVKLWLLTP